MTATGEALAWMALAEIAGDGSEEWVRAAAMAGSARDLFAAKVSRVREFGLSERAALRLRGFRHWGRLRERHAALTRAGFSLTAPGDEAYPESLLEIRDVPVLLYYRGCPPASLEPAVAVVGARRATAYGRRVARELARRLASSDVAVVSGLARGIDAAAHRGALETGKTAAVLAGGLDRVYPREHEGLFETIVRSCCALSEYPPGTPHLPHHFPVRNRIITGMTQATIVVEADERSGSLVSAGRALDQGREVYAVPGNIDSRVSRGTNGLIRDGAVPVGSIEDLEIVLAQVVPGRRAPGRERVSSRRARPACTGDALRVLEALESAPQHVDAVVEATRLDGARVLELLTGLELEGLAERTASGAYVAVAPVL